MVTSKRAPGYFVPVDESGNVGMSLTGRKQTQAQTHNAVSVGSGSGSYNNTWIDCNGYDQVGVTMLADAGVAGTGVYAAWSNDGVTQHGYENVIPTSGLASTSKSGGVPVRARYLKLQAFNSDATTHTMSTWAYLKA